MVHAKLDFLNFNTVMFATVTHVFDMAMFNSTIACYHYHDC